MGELCDCPECLSLAPEQIDLETARVLTARAGEH